MVGRGRTARPRRRRARSSEPRADPLGVGEVPRGAADDVAGRLPRCAADEAGDASSARRAEVHVAAGGLASAPCPPARAGRRPSTTGRRTFSTTAWTGRRRRPSSRARDEPGDDVRADVGLAGAGRALHGEVRAVEVEQGGGDGVDVARGGSPTTGERRAAALARAAGGAAGRAPRRGGQLRQRRRRPRSATSAEGVVDRAVVLRPATGDSAPTGSAACSAPTSGRAPRRASTSVEAAVGAIGLDGSRTVERAATARRSGRARLTIAVGRGVVVAWRDARRPGRSGLPGVELARRAGRPPRGALRAAAGASRLDDLGRARSTNDVAAGRPSRRRVRAAGRSAPTRTASPRGGGSRRPRRRGRRPAARACGRGRGRRRAGPRSSVSSSSSGRAARSLASRLGASRVDAAAVGGAGARPRGRSSQSRSRRVETQSYAL